MHIEGATALVTGANRGIGADFVQRLLARGALRVYAASRGGDVAGGDGVVPVRLDVTDPSQVAAAAELASDVDLVVNNAGISTGTRLVTGDLDQVRREMETNFFGPLHVVRAFAPVLAARGGGAVVDVVSALSWFTAPGAGAYAASKAAAWSLTDSVRQELAEQGTLVVGVHMGLVDTDMAAGMDAPKLRPAELTDAALDAVESGTLEVLADDWTRAVKAGLSLDPAERYRRLFGG
ncbi:SDR family oxidoreductase [Nocardioides litoris]|uniref:SDR family oxidoreductase n=1 Tax=Nocardioides litoris TaxID=1926648 RepID=UPI00111EA8B1|nr:SDR family oxidoreductase [Nocardioides litoris]